MMRSTKNHSDETSWLHGATIQGKRPARSHDFLFVGGKDDRLAIVGREIREQWPARGAKYEPATLRAFSEIAVHFLPLPSRDPDTLKGRFDEGFRALVEKTQGQLQEEEGVPAWSLTLAHAQGRLLHVGHVGDSRCYLASDGILRRLTRDHTYAPQPPDRPLVSDPAMGKKLSSVVGGFSDDLMVQTTQIELPPASLVVLCTAGVSRVLADDALQELIARHERISALTLCSRIVRATGHTLDGADRTVACAKFP